MTRPRHLALALTALLAAPGAEAGQHPQAAEEARFRTERLAMVASQIEAQGVKDRRALDALRAVPRHEFVPPELRGRAYGDYPLPIGYGQTISQPYVVAHMTEIVRPRPGMRVLEVGTGSGYQAAVLAELVRSVYTIEIVEPLAVEARERLARLGYRNVVVRTGDGYKGWEEQAPFDAIMVTAGAPEVPPPLLRQLKPGGRMVIPVGPADRIQYLTLIEKQADGSIRSRQIVPVRFVPLTRER